MQNNENLTLSEWIDRMLVKRGLEKADGRHIYQYRISDNEFRDLEEFLRNYIAIGQSHKGFAWLAKRAAFPRLFVLYGAEWWRRRYDGSGFSWDGILNDLGANDEEWNQAQRSECVRTGMQAWKLPIIEGTGFRFLGSIAIQGGLPMKTLAEAHGRINDLLGRVLRSANNRLVDPNEIQAWIEEWQNILPKSYRQPAIFILLADIAWTVLTLKQKAGLESGADAIAQLDQKIPGWREQFPLPIEDNQARALIEKLVREAASVRLPKATVCLPVERFLEKSVEGEWKLSSSIGLPDTIDETKLAKLFNSTTEELPRFGELSVTAGEKTKTASIRKLAGNSSFRIEGAAWEFTGNAAAHEHLLRLASGDGRVWNVAAMKGQLLENDLPWIFAGENEKFRFVGQGTIKIGEKEALIALPSGWKFSSETNRDNFQIGALSEFSREIHRTTETVSLENSTGAMCGIKLHSAEDGAENLEWRGRRWWLDFLSPSIAFRGKPNLYRVDETGTAVKINGAVNCAVIGAPGSSRSIGPVKLTYVSNGELKYQSRMTLLPEEADLSLLFGDALSGAIVFKNWELARAIIKTQNVSSHQEIKGDSLILNLAVAPEHRAPDQVTIELYWHHTAACVRLALPFPSKGTRAFSSTGKELPNDSRLSVNRLLGVRLIVLTGGGASKKIRLKLQAASGGSQRKYQLQSLPGSFGVEIKLNDYLTDINHLLSLDDSPDSKVKLSVSIEGAESFALNLARYESLIERADEYVTISVDDSGTAENFAIGDLRVMAMRLEDAHEEPDALLMTEEVEDGKSNWQFSPAERKPGAWLIYPGADSAVAFRPTLWTIFGESEGAASEFARAVSLADENERKKAFDDLIKHLAEDYTHPAWEEIARLAAVVGHLPLTTLDIWRRFSRSASAMAAIAFRYGKLPNGFVSRFEKELPFSWEAIPFSIWKRAIKKSFEYCENLFGADAGKIIFEAHAQRRINILTARHGGLTFLLGIASKEFFPEAERDAAQLLPAGEFLGRSQMENCLMNLRRLRGEDEWIRDSDNLLEKKWTNPTFNQFFHTVDLGFQNDVINLPLMLAADAAAGGSASWLKDSAKIHLLRTFRAFDSEWFDEAYNWTIARCLAKGLLDD